MSLLIIALIVLAIIGAVASSGMLRSEKRWSEAVEDPESRRVDREPGESEEPNE